MRIITISLCALAFASGPALAEPSNPGTPRAAGAVVTTSASNHGTPPTAAGTTSACNHGTPPNARLIGGDYGRPTAVAPSTPATTPPRGTAVTTSCSNHGTPPTTAAPSTTNPPPPPR